MPGVASIALRAAGWTWPRPSADPISRWELDETSSAEGVFEDRGPAHVLMILSGIWVDLTTGSLVEGGGGTSAYTDGSGYATIPANQVAHNLAALTISFYYQRNSEAKHILLAAGNGGQAGDFSIEVLANGRLRAWHTGQDGQLRFFESTSGITGTNLQVGTAHRIDLTLGPQGARLHLDGAELTAAVILANTNGWNNGRVKYLGRWTDGVQSPAVGVFDRLRLWDRQLTSAEIALLEPAQSATLPQPEPDGTWVDLGNADDKETTTNLSEGGSARYDASGIVWRTRWLGDQGCSSPKRSATTNQFLIRFEAAHNGGSIRGGAMYGNLTPDDDYDPADHGFALYPCSDGGQFYFGNNRDILSFTVEGFRFHSCWDPIRTPGRAGSGTELTDCAIVGCWFTCIRDDVIENDGRNQISITDNLIGDTIGRNTGCWVFLSMAGSTGTDNSDRTITISGNLIWSSLLRATSRPNDVNGYACGNLFKFGGALGNAPRLHMTNNIIMADHIGIHGGGGNPLNTLLGDGGNLLEVSSGNIMIWRDQGNLGKWSSLGFDLPPGFTLLEGSEGEDFWDAQVAAWKTLHPNVRRLNKTGVARPFGGTTSIVDQG